MVYNLKDKSNESSPQKAPLEILFTSNKGVRRSAIHFILPQLFQSRWATPDVLGTESGGGRGGVRRLLKSISISCAARIYVRTVGV